MTYIPEARIEARAARLRQQHALAPGFDVEQLLDDLGLGLVWEPIPDEPGSVVLGQLIPEQQLVVLNEHHLDELEKKKAASAVTPSVTRSATGNCTPIMRVPACSACSPETASGPDRLR